MRLYVQTVTAHNFVRGVDLKALPQYVYGVIDGDVPNLDSRHLTNGQIAYWDPDKVIVVIEHGHSGTVFTPKDGRA